MEWNKKNCLSLHRYNYKITTNNSYSSAMKQLPSQIITRGLLIVVCWLWGMGASHSYAQNLTVESITEHANDVIGRADTRLDLNDEPCALLKFSMPAPITKVAGNYIGEPVRKNNEQWVYITNGANRIDITAEGYLPLSINFPQYGIRRVKGGIVYRIKLKEEVEGEDWTAEELYGMGVANYRQEQFQQAFDWLQKAAHKGSAEAILLIGDMYANGDGIEKSEEKAFCCFKQAAETGNVKTGDLEAHLIVASAYLEGKGVKADTAQAIYWIKKGMEGNNSWAYGKMALMYEEGTGMEKDPRKAFELMSKSAELGSAAGIFYLGKYYELGFGTEADHQAALRYFRKAKAGGLEAAGKLLDRLSAEEFKTHYSSPRETFLQIWKEVEEETIK